MRRFTLLLVGVVALIGCASSQQDPSLRGDNSENKDDNGEMKYKARIAQFLELSPYWLKENGAGQDYLDSYTSLIVYSPDNDNTKGVRGSLESPEILPSDHMIEPTEKIKDRKYEPRNWFSRLFSDISTSSTLTLEMTAPDYSTTVPLAIMEFNSNSENGDQWYRMMAVRREAFPLFLVKRNGDNSKIGLKFNVHKSHKSKSNAGQLLKTTLDTLSTVSPQLTVITTLNKHFSDAAKNAVDKSLSANFSKSLQEDLIRDVSLMEILPGSNIQVEFRDTESDRIFVNEEPLPIGLWRVMFDYPRPSVFAAYRICKEPKSNNTNVRDNPHTYLNGCLSTRTEAERKVLEVVNSSDILDFSLVFGAEDKQNFGTISSYLRQQSWFGDFLASANSRTQLDSLAGGFCRKIRNAVVEVNLNYFDADLVVWAVKKGMPLSSESIAALEGKSNKGQDCFTRRDTIL
jgi:hypothetical protein